MDDKNIDTKLWQAAIVGIREHLRTINSWSTFTATQYSSSTHKKVLYAQEMADQLGHEYGGSLRQLKQTKENGISTTRDYLNVGKPIEEAKDGSLVNVHTPDKYLSEAVEVYLQGSKKQRRTARHPAEADKVEVKRMYKDFLTSLFHELSTKRFTPALLGGKSFKEAKVLFLSSEPAEAVTNNSTSVRSRPSRMVIGHFLAGRIAQASWWQMWEGRSIIPARTQPEIMHQGVSRKMKRLLDKYDLGSEEYKEIANLKCFKIPINKDQHFEKAKQWPIWKLAIENALASAGWNLDFGLPRDPDTKRWLTVASAQSAQTNSVNFQWCLPLKISFLPGSEFKRLVNHICLGSQVFLSAVKNIDMR
ncbi:hypothetical protein FMEXI_7584 [Fusarium mexicanum]|uniref:Uncharacterized protein n=1 Tax=Fusarium mexicanum TaxID=751941 RepID=A0A8H5ISP8_9HYPO|nr:hypothetical protein FMEXI_7584 [Fusarium mexicanum]